MRFHCAVDVEKRGILPLPKRRAFQKIIRSVFKGVAEGDTIECFRKDNVTRRITM